MKYEEAALWLRSNWGRLPKTLQGQCTFFGDLNGTLKCWAEIIKSETSDEKEVKRAKNWVVIAVKDLQELPQGWDQPMQGATGNSIYPIQEQKE